MSNLVLIRGPICAGKSTILNLLQDLTQKCSTVRQDGIKRAIGKNKSSPWRNKIAFETTLYLTELLIKERRNIVADIHSSRLNQYRKYKKIASKYGYNFFSFLLYPPLKTCIKRNYQREIPGVNYVITEKEIKDYWQDSIFIKGEPIFDTSKLEVLEIVKGILKATKLSA